MAETPDKQSIYYIPENFIGESKLLGGRIRTRYLIDSVILAAIFALIFTFPIVGIALKNASLQVKITMIVITIAPGILIGQIGYNGDPASVFLLNFISWLKKKQTRLYNETPRLLGTDPVKAIYENSKKMDVIVNKFQQIQEARIEKKNSTEYIEGETFEFTYDPGIDDYLEDVGDYSDDALDNEDSWPVANVAIASGNDLNNLKKALESDDWYGDDDEEESPTHRNYDSYFEGNEDTESIENRNSSEDHDDDYYSDNYDDDDEDER